MMLFWPNAITQRLYSLESDPVDDKIDRLNYVLTVSVIVFFTFLTGTKQHFGSPIECMAPSHFTGVWLNYVHDYCFVSNTYSVNFSVSLSDGKLANGRKKELVYYQWIPYVLALQALALFLPKGIWSSFLSLYGCDIQTLVEEAKKLKSEVKITVRKTCVENLSRFFMEQLDSGYTHSFLGVFYKNRIVTVVYVFVKWCFCAVAFMQLVLISKFVGDGQAIWGFHLAYKLYKGDNWRTSGIFPRVTFCDLEMFGVGQSNIETVQCVLMINILNEKLYLFLWFWFLLLLAVDLVSAVHSTLGLIFPFLRRISIRNMLTVRERFTQNENKFSELMSDVLGADGWLLLSFIRCRAGGMVADDLTREIFNIIAISYGPKALRMSPESIEAMLERCCAGCETYTGTSRVQPTCPFPSGSSCSTIILRSRMSYNRCDASGFRDEHSGKIL